MLRTQDHNFLVDDYCIAWHIRQQIKRCICNHFFVILHKHRSDQRLSASPFIISKGKAIGFGKVRMFLVQRESRQNEMYQRTSTIFLKKLQEKRKEESRSLTSTIVKQRCHWFFIFHYWHTTLSCDSQLLLFLYANQVIIDMTEGGADYCFECIGVPSLIREAFACCRKVSPLALLPF